MKLMRIQLLALFLFVSTLIPLFAGRSVGYAQNVTTGTYINHATVKVGNNEYTDPDPWDDDHNFQYTANGCTSRVDVPDVSDLTKASLDFQQRPPGAECTNTESDLTMGAVDKFLIAFAQSDADTIIRIDGDNSWTFRKGASGIYLRVSEEGEDCQDVIELRQVGSQTWADVYEHDENGSGDPSGYGDCRFELESNLGDGDEYDGGQFVSFLVGSPEDVRQPISTSASSSESCESEGTSLSWIICPLLGLLDDGISYLDNQINSLLEVPDSYYNNPEVEATWARLRNLAYIILVPVLLVMVIGTALGFDFLDAYTIKKALPRLLAAVVFIALSWEITSFLITLTNNVGKGTLGLVTSSFEGASNLSLGELFKPDAADSTVFGTFALGGLVALAAATSFGIVFSYFVVGLVLLLVGFFVLAFRQFFIIALALVAPLAILAWIFPGNDKLWKLWWGAFSKLLMMFPLIYLLLGVGRVFASIINQAGGNGLIEMSLKFMAYVLPYAFIPLTFRFAGGLFGTLTGMVNDRSRGLFDKQKKYRQETRAGLRERASSNNRFNPNRKWVNRLKLNELASWGADPMSNVAYYGKNIPGLSGKGQKIKAAIEGKSSEQTGKFFQELNDVYKFNDKAYRALSGAHQEFSDETKSQLRAKNLYGKAPKTLQEFQDMAKILSASTSATEQIAGNVLQGASGRMASLYSDPEMGKVNLQAAGILGLSAHGFASGKDLAYVGNSLMASGTSAELAQSFISGAQVAGQRQRPDIKAGYGTVFKGGKFVSGISAEGGRAKSLITTLSSMDLAGAKGAALEELTPTIEDMLKGPSPELAARVAAGPPPPGSDEKIVKQYEKDLKDFQNAPGEAAAVKEQLFSWAGPYSQASVDVKTQALQIIANNGLQQEFDDRRRAETTGVRRGDGTGGGEDEGGGH